MQNAILFDSVSFSFFVLSNLDETTKSVYKENVRLNEALNYHIKAGQDLSQVCSYTKLSYTILNSQNAAIVCFNLIRTENCFKLY